MRFTDCLKSEYLNCALLGYYAASRGNFLPTCRDNLTVSSSWFKNPKRLILFGFSLRNNPEERSSQLLRGRSLKSRWMSFALLWTWSDSCSGWFIPSKIIQRTYYTKAVVPSAGVQKEISFSARIRTPALQLMTSYFSKIFRHIFSQHVRWYVYSCRSYKYRTPDTQVIYLSRFCR